MYLFSMLNKINLMRFLKTVQISLVLTKTDSYENLPVWGHSQVVISNLWRANHLRIWKLYFLALRFC